MSCELSSPFARQRDYGTTEVARCLRCPQYIWRIATGADGEKEVAALRERLHLACEHALETIVITDCGEDRGVRRKGHGGKSTTLGDDRPTSSATRCCESVALPPLPQARTLWSASQAVIEGAHDTSEISGSSWAARTITVACSSKTFAMVINNPTRASSWHFPRARARAGKDHRISARPCRRLRLLLLFPSRFVREPL